MAELLCDPSPARASGLGAAAASGTVTRPMPFRSELGSQLAFFPVREALANQLAQLEDRLEDDLERAAVALPEIADAIHVPSPDKVQKISDEAARLRQAGRSVDSELVIVSARQTPVAGDLRLVLALIEVAQHSVLIANHLTSSASS
jgi:phosphate uptake regulator